MTEKNHPHDAVVLWFSGLSGSGKTTIAKELMRRMEGKGKKVRIIDGDDIRNSEHKHLGFSREDILENNRLIVELCKKSLREYDCILVPIISPFAISRENARKELGKAFVEVYVNAGLEACVRRDVKGLYKKALAGQIKNFIGVDKDTPYEPPKNPEVVIYSEKDNVDESVGKVMDFLVQKEKGMK